MSWKQLLISVQKQKNGKLPRGQRGNGGGSKKHPVPQREMSPHSSDDDTVDDAVSKHPKIPGVDDVCSPYHSFWAINYKHFSASDALHTRTKPIAIFSYISWRHNCGKKKSDNSGSHGSRAIGWREGGCFACLYITRPHRQFKVSMEWAFLHLTTISLASSLHQRRRCRRLSDLLPNIGWTSTCLIRPQLQRKPSPSQSLTQPGRRFE